MSGVDEDDEAIVEWQLRRARSAWHLESHPLGALVRDPESTGSGGLVLLAVLMLWAWLLALWHAGSLHDTTALVIGTTTTVAMVGGWFVGCRRLAARQNVQLRELGRHQGWQILEREEVKVWLRRHWPARYVLAPSTVSFATSSGGYPVLIDSYYACILLATWNPDDVYLNEMLATPSVAPHIGTIRGLGFIVRWRNGGLYARSKLPLDATTAGDFAKAISELEAVARAVGMPPAPDLDGPMYRRPVLALGESDAGRDSIAERRHRNG